MFPELNDFFNLDMQQLSNDLNITILESGNSDASFLPNHFISMYLKSGHSVCLVSFAQSFTHYSSIANKLGVSLAKCCEAERFAMIEGLKLLGGDIITENENAPSYCQNINASCGEEMDCLQNLYRKICSAYTGLLNKSETSKPPLMLLDDLSMLISLGFRTHNIAVFVQYLDALVHDGSKSDKSFSGSLVAGIHMDLMTSDPELEQLFLQLAYRSDIVCYVSPLKTGYCRDVQGELVAEFRQRNGASGSRHMTKQGIHSMHYKIKDKNILLFPPGTSTAVL